MCVVACLLFYVAAHSLQCYGTSVLWFGINILFVDFFGIIVNLTFVLSDAFVDFLYQHTIIGLHWFLLAHLFSLVFVCFVWFWGWWCISRQHSLAPLMH